MNSARARNYKRTRRIQWDYIVDPDDYHERFDLISKMRFLARPELHRGWRISAKEIAEARAWLAAHDRPQAGDNGPRPPIEEQAAHG